MGSIRDVLVRLSWFEPITEENELKIIKSCGLFNCNMITGQTDSKWRLFEKISNPVSINSNEIKCQLTDTTK